MGAGPGGIRSGALGRPDGPRLARRAPELLADRLALDPEREVHVRALAVMRRNMAGPDFSLARAARELGIFERSLQRAFSRQGTTCSAELLRLRLSAAP